MTRRCQMYAWLGAIGWLMVTAAALTVLFARRFGAEWTADLSDEALYVILGIAALLQFGCFWFGYRNLARAKEYPQTVSWIGLLGPVLQLGAFAVLCTLPDHSSWRSESDEDVRPKSDHGRRHHHGLSPRQRALRWLAPGLLCIGFAIALVLLRIPDLFEREDTQFMVAILVFMAGYVSVLRGCWWLVRAKGWDDAIIFIGVMPLAVFFVPGKRLFVPMVASFLPIAMVMAPLILLVITLVLPDKTRNPKTKRRRRRGEDAVTRRDDV